MTLDFAKKEAKRRDEVLGTKHIVVRRKSMRDDDMAYMILLHDHILLMHTIDFDTFQD